MKKLPSVSIIIPTLNRKEVLRKALLSLNEVDYPRDRLEVVVVSDGSTDGTEKMIPELRKKLNYRFVFLKEKRVGISHAKNVAIKNSQGEIIVSTDDDCLFEKGWLKELIKPFNRPRVGAVGGPDRAVKKQGIMAKSIDFAFSSFIGSGGIHGRFLPVKLGKFYPVGCNTAFSRKVLDKVGLFDENLAPGEDTDLNHRIEKAGFKLVYAPRAFVWHRPRTSLKTFAPYILKRGAARVEIIRRHHQFAELIYFLPATMVLSAIALITLSFFWPVFFKLLLFLLGFYWLVVLTAGISAFLTYRYPFYLFLVPLLIFFQHTLHGIGFWIAIGKRLFKNK